MTQDDVRRIALALPGAVEAEERFAFSVPVRGRMKGFCWDWLERIHPRRARVPNPGVLVIRVADLFEKEMLIQADPETFFTEPHYNGYPAILVRLAAIGEEELRSLIVEGWRCVAPPELRRLPTG